MRYEIYRQLYDFELAQRDHLISAVNIPMVVATILGSALGTMMMTFPYAKSAGSSGWAFCGLVLVGLLALIAAIFALVRSLVGYEYARTASPKCWQEYFDKLVEMYSTFPEQPFLAQAGFDKRFHERLAEATDENSAQNRKRSDFLYKANLCCVVALIAVALAAVPYVFASVKYGDHVEQVRIVP